MSFLDLYKDIKSIIAKHLSNDQKSSQMFMSYLTFGEIVFDNDFHKLKTTPGRMNDDDDLYNAKIYKIYNV
jgi:hypothetical protein